MKYLLVDRVLERTSERIVTVKSVTRAEEYLADHFPTFPVLPGVMMIEALTQAARHLLADRSALPLVLGGIRAVRFGRFVRPGETLRVEVSLLSVDRERPTWTCKGTGTVLDAEGGPAAAEGGSSVVAVTGRLVLRPVRRGVAPHSPAPAASPV